MICLSSGQFKSSVSLNHSVSIFFVLHLALLTCWATFQAKDNVRSAPVSSALTKVLHTYHKSTVDKGMEFKGEQS